MGKRLALADTPRRHRTSPRGTGSHPGAGALCISATTRPQSSRTA